MTKLLANHLNKTALNQPSAVTVSKNRNQVDKNSTLTALQSGGQTKNNFSHQKETDTSLYSVGYIFNPSTANDLSTNLNDSIVDYSTIQITSPETTSIPNPSISSDPTTTTFPPTTLDYTTPFTTATKSAQNLLQMLQDINDIEGNNLKQEVVYQNMEHVLS